MRGQKTVREQSKNGQSILWPFSQPGPLGNAGKINVNADALSRNTILNEAKSKNLHEDNDDTFMTAQEKMNLLRKLLWKLIKKIISKMKYIEK